MLFMLSAPFWPRAFYDVATVRHAEAFRARYYARWSVFRQQHGVQTVTPNSALLTDAYLALRASFGAATADVSSQHTPLVSDRAYDEAWQMFRTATRCCGLRDAMVLPIGVLVVGIALLALCLRQRIGAGRFGRIRSRLGPCRYRAGRKRISKSKVSGVLVAVNRSFDFQSSSAVLFTR